MKETTRPPPARSGQRTKKGGVRTGLGCSGLCLDHRIVGIVSKIGIAKGRPALGAKTHSFQTLFTEHLLCASRYLVGGVLGV